MTYARLFFNSVYQNCKSLFKIHHSPHLWSVSEHSDVTFRWNYVLHFNKTYIILNPFIYIFHLLLHSWELGFTNSVSYSFQINRTFRNIYVSKIHTITFWCKHSDRYSPLRFISQLESNTYMGMGIPTMAEFQFMYECMYVWKLIKGL